MLLSAPHLFSTFNGKFHFTFFLADDIYTLTLLLFFWRQWEKSSPGRRFSLTFCISWIKVVCALKWLPDPAEGWKCELDVTLVGCPGEGSHSSSAVLHKLLCSHLGEAQTPAPGCQGGRVLSLETRHLTSVPFHFLTLLMMSQKALSSQSKFGWWKLSSSLPGRRACRSPEHICTETTGTALLPLLVNKSNPAGDKNSLTSSFYYLFNILDGSQCFSRKCLSNCAQPSLAVWGGSEQLLWGLIRAAAF